jgi:hypothetical protein
VFNTLLFMPTNNPNIPTITDLVFAGDPRLRAEARRGKTSPSKVENLNMRIDQIETAIGQDASGPLGRAFAIRAEEGCD